MRLWRALEDMRSWAGVRAVWREHLEDELELIEPWLLPREELAMSIPGPGGIPRQVVVHGDDDIVIVDSVSNDVDSIRREELIVYELDDLRLMASISAALGLLGTCVAKANQLWRLGEFVPIEGERFPVCLVCPSGPDEMTDLASQAVVDSERPTVVITPTRRHHSDSLTHLTSGHRFAILTLEDVCGIEKPGTVSPAEDLTSVLEAFLKTHAPTAVDRVQPPRFPTPAGAVWSDVSIRFVDGHTVSISVRGKTRRYTYLDIGMADKRSRQPTLQWELLHAFATERGVLNWSSSSATRRNQKRRERLADDLQEFFGINTDPFVYEEGGWRALFFVSPD